MRDQAPVIGSQPLLSGIDHLAITVTDLDVSERFYCEVFGLVVVMDVGSARVCMHPATGLVISIVVHPGAHGGRFSELNTGVDHVGLSVRSRDELERWERHLDAHGVSYTPIRDELFGSHLNFRDPDGIALELTSANALMDRARESLAGGQMTSADIAAFIAEHVSPDYVAARPPGG